MCPWVGVCGQGRRGQKRRRGTEERARLVVGGDVLVAINGDDAAVAVLGALAVLACVRGGGGGEKGVRWVFRHRRRAVQLLLRLDQARA